MNKIVLLKKLDAVAGTTIARLLPRPKIIPVNTVTVQRVLVIRPGGIGDAVLLIPAIQALQLYYPDVTIDVLAEKRNGTAFELCQQVAQVWCYDNWRDWRQLFSHRYDLIIDTEQWHYLSAVIARMLPAPLRCGFATNKRSRLFTHTALYDQNCYEIDSFYRLLDALAVKIPPQTTQSFLHLSPNVTARSNKLLQPLHGQPFVVLFPGASIEERRWSTASFALLAQRCLDGGYGVVMVGGKVDNKSARKILAKLNNNSGLDLTGKTSLAETAAILKSASLLVSGDSGVLHLAAGVNCQTVALFGPGIEKKWAPPGDKHHTVNLHLPCSPCTVFGTTPPCQRNGECIKTISVDMVWSVVNLILNG